MIKQTKYKDYYVDDLGNVYSKKSGDLVKLKPQKNTYGYLMVSIYQKKVKVHRLVAETFISNPDNKPHIDHINTIRTDNRISNLQWCTPKENRNNPMTKQKMEEYYNSQEYQIKKEKMKQNMKEYYDSEKGKRELFYCSIAGIISSQTEQYINMDYVACRDYYQRPQRTEAYRKKMSEAKKGKSNPKGRKHNYQDVYKYYCKHKDLSFRELGRKLKCRGETVKKIVEMMEKD